MNIINDLFLLQRIDHLVRARATGTPKQLADRLKTCERNIYRLIGHLRDIGLPIAYDKQRDTYYYAGDVQLRFLLAVDSEKLLEINGGEKK